ncbi:Rv3654c family TadE-like protein [Streptosporangium sp. NPDC049376]|uniref:Rv3654c family TadE-like protein n=1 Tax=Streptosporangium sp. NPDC049376 TaxID=3366192 RepID=UPI00379818AC
MRRRGPDGRQTRKATRNAETAAGPTGGSIGTTSRTAGRRRGADRGGATIWMAGFMTLVLMAMAVIMLAGTVRAARHRAMSAADLSALAAARLAFADPRRACAQAASLAEGNGVRLTRCSVNGHGVADVQVTVRLRLPTVGSQTVTAVARAGPVQLTVPTGEADEAVRGPPPERPSPSRRSAAPVPAVDSGS